MLTPEEERELRRLQELAYGADRDAPVGDDALDRLRTLTERQRTVAAATIAPTVPDEALAPDATVPARRQARGGLILAAVIGGMGLFFAGYLAAAGIGAGSGIARPPTDFPEFARPQTDEDSFGQAVDLELDPASTRYIATVAGYTIYLAHPAASDGVCIAATSTRDVAYYSSSCGSGEGTLGGVVSGVEAGLSIAVGPLGPGTVDGDPVVLSESVTAYIVR